MRENPAQPSVLCLYVQPTAKKPHPVSGYVCLKCLPPAELCDRNGQIWNASLPFSWSVHLIAGIWQGPVGFIGVAWHDHEPVATIKIAAGCQTHDVLPLPPVFPSFISACFCKPGWPIPLLPHVHRHRFSPSYLVLHHFSYSTIW
jgi:hypothetical protein